MQNSMWKFATLLGVIGVGCLVIMQLQKRMPVKTAAAEMQISPTGQAVPPEQQSHDPFGGITTSGESAFSMEQFEPAELKGPADFGGEPIAQAAYEAPEQDPTQGTRLAGFNSEPDPFGAGAFGQDAPDASGVSEDQFTAAPAQSEPRQSVSVVDEIFGDAAGAVAEKTNDLAAAAARVGGNAADDFGGVFDDVQEVASAVTEPVQEMAGGLFDAAPVDPDPFANDAPAAPMTPGPVDDIFGNEVDPPYEPAPFVSEESAISSVSPAAPPTLPEFEDTDAEQWAVEEYSQAPPAEPAVLPAPDPRLYDQVPPELPRYPEATIHQPRQLDPPRVEPIPLATQQPPTPTLRRMSGSRPRKSYDSVPHGTLRPQLRIEKSAPSTASIGKPLVYSIFIKNVGNAVAHEVIVEDQIPRDADLTGTIPQAELVEGILVWRFESLEPQQQKEVKIRVVPTREGQIGSVATVNFKAEIGSRTTVTAPKLRLELVGSKEARVGDTVEFQYRVVNEGSGDATNVWITNPLPEQLQHPAGRELEYEVGDLAAGKSHNVTLQLVAYKPGSRIPNTAVVSADGVAGDSAEARLDILGAQLQVTRRGPSKRYLNRRAIYENTVVNTTRRDAENATLVEHVPRGMKFIEANNGGQYNDIKRTITWPIRRIRASGQEVFTAVLAPVRAGTHESVVQIVENAGMFKSRANSVTQVVHLDNMGLQLSELDGPVEVGETVTFTISVRNRGTSTATRSVLSLEIPPELTVTAAGPTEPQPRGNTLVFPAVPQIAPNAQVRFQVQFTAKRIAHDIRLKASIRSDQMPNSLSETESITIYGDETSRR